MTQTQPFRRTDVLILSAISLTLVVYHLVTSSLGHYGYFIDEVYYVACADRLDWGYVDHPPLSIVLLAFVRGVLGDSLPALRLLPAMAIAGTVFLTGRLAMRFGGGRTSMIIAALAAVASPVFLLFGSFYSMNAFEIFLCTGVVLLLVRLLQEERTRDWLWIGALVGLGLQMKHTMVLYVVAVGLGVLASSARRLLWNRWFALGSLAAALIVLPNLVWQFAHGFPSLEFYRNAMTNKNIPTSAGGILAGQLLFNGPAAAPLWMIGGAALFGLPRLRPLRCFGWAFVFLLLVMIVSGSSRPDRIMAIYPVLFAAGAAAVSLIGRRGPRLAVEASLIVVLLAGAVAAAPVVTPALSPESTQSYLRAIGWNFSVESGKVGDPLPQWLGDRLGWRELAQEVSRIYSSLPPDERSGAVIVSTNYGEAGALEVYAREFPLPRVYATHNSYHMWGPPQASATVFIAVYVDRPGLERLFESVEEVAVHECEFCTRPQQRIPIYVAHRPRVDLTAAWPQFKIFN
ncbi:MAG: glycosyltransferase family 39 protein [Bacteroidetes bacterium]|jgi:hypothetical protein|nr:glycosyltransferase family 39 protein [Bacteroidota bacterium]